MVVITKGETLAAWSPGFFERRMLTGEFVPDARRPNTFLSPHYAKRSDTARTLVGSTSPVGMVWPVTSST